MPCLYTPGCCSQQHHAGVGLNSKALATAQKWPGELTATVKLPPKHSMGSCVFSMSCSTSNGHPNISCIPYKCITHQTKVTCRYLLMPYYQKAFFGSLKKSPSEFAGVMAPASCRHAYTRARSDFKGHFPCSGQFTLQDLHLSGLAVYLLKGNTAENSGWNFPTPKFTTNAGFASLSKIAPSHSKQQTQPYDHTLGLNTAPPSHFETLVP